MTSLLDRWMIDRLVDRQRQLVDRVEVVLRRRIRSIEAERVVRGHQLDVGSAELPVGAGIVRVPRELLGDDANDGRLALGRERIDARGPRRNGERDDQHELDSRHRPLDVARHVALHALVVRLRVGALRGSG